MKKIRITTLGLCGLLSLIMAVSIVSGCGSSRRPMVSAASDAATRDAPTQLFGMWQLVRVSGGIAGGGYPVTPGMEILTFNEGGAFTRLVNGQAEQGTYQVKARSTLFSESDTPVITYSNQSQNEMIFQVDSTSLVLAEEATDGYTREYERVLQTGG